MAVKRIKGYLEFKNKEYRKSIICNILIVKFYIL